MNRAFKSQFIMVPMYDPMIGTYEKPNEKIAPKATTTIMKITTSPRFLVTKLKDLLVLSTASRFSIIAITTINKAIGSKIMVMLHRAAIMDVTINTLILLIMRFKLLFKSINRLLMASLAISTVMQAAIKPIIAAISKPKKLMKGFGASK